MLARISTLEKYCKNYTLIENYGKAMRDRHVKWICHHRFEIEKNMSAKELKDANLYYDRPPEELIFVTPAEHCKIHFKDKHQTELHKKRRSEALKNKVVSCSTKYKMSKAKVKNNLWVLFDKNGEPIWIELVPFDYSNTDFKKIELGTDDFFEYFFLLKNGKTEWSNIPFENEKQYWAEVTRIHKMCGPARRAFFEKYPDWKQADFSY